MLDCCSAVAEDDPAAGEVVRAAAPRRRGPPGGSGCSAGASCPRCGEDLVSVAQLDAEHRVRKRLDDRAFDLDDTVLLRPCPPQSVVLLRARPSYWPH